MELLDEPIEYYHSSEEQCWDSFIGPNSIYFISKWRIFKTQKRYFSFNLSALCLSGFWFGYRKMYTLGVLLSIWPCTAIYVLFCRNFDALTVVFIAFYIIETILVSFIADWAYYKQYQQKTFQGGNRCLNTQSYDAQSKSIQIMTTVIILLNIYKIQTI